MQRLLLLHGAMGAQTQFEKLRNELENDFIVHTLNFTAHGGTTITETPLSIELFAADILHYLDNNDLDTVNIFGYSMGGYAGMYIAKYFPSRITKLMTLATKFYWDEAVAAKEIKMLDAATIELKVPAFAKQLAERHAPFDWKLLLHKTALMMEDLGKNNTLKQDDFLDITTPCLIILGDRDKMVTLDETIAVYKSLPHAQMNILPNTPHPLEQVNNKLLAYTIKHFLNNAD